MFGKSKGQKQRKRNTDDDVNRPRPSLAQYGLLDIPNVSDLALGGGIEDDGDDSDLEAELLALTGEAGSREPKRVKKVNPENLDKMVAECMNDNYEDEAFDEEDPDLLAELSALGPAEDEEDNSSSTASQTPKNLPVSSPEKPKPVIIRPSPFVAGFSVVNLLKERIEMYKEAEENALSTGETARAKRFSRGLKTMNQMLKSVNAGNSINEENIPPAVLLHSRNSSVSDLTESKRESPKPVLPPRVSSATIPQSIVFNEDKLPVEEELPVNSLRNKSLPLKPFYPDIPDESPSPRNSPCQPPPQHDSFSPPAIQNSSPDIPKDTVTDSLSPVNPESSSQTLPSVLSIVLKRQHEYKMAALSAKKKGSVEEAVQLMRTAKQFEPLIQAAKEGQNVDLDSLPPSPNSPTKNSKDSEPKSKVDPNPRSSNASTDLNRQTPDEPPPPTVTAPSNPTSVVEALEQRLAKYAEQRDKAKAEGNARKQRMNERIMKQYQDAIRTHKLGQLVDFNELPTPPGFPPIPAGGSVRSPAAPLPAASQASPETVSHRSDVPQAPQPSTVPRDTPQAPQPSVNTQVKPQAPQRPQAQVQPPKPQAKTNVRKNPQSMVERQLSVLKRRHDQFKFAALEAKKRGEIEQAKEYVRNYKGIEQLIGATEGGLPVDMNTVPIPPQEKLGCENTSVDFEVIDKEDCVSPGTTDADMALTYTKLEEDLIAQIKMCAHTREHFKALGDVASANRFEQLILHTKKDLDTVRSAFKRGDTPPRFHYENRTFTLIQCNTDLNDSDCEVCIVRGINFNVPNPSGVDTYVKIEFPYPTDAPPQERSNVVKDTNNPEFNHKVVFSIDRKARALSRIFKRHSVKCQIIAKGGWFHRDAVLGSVKIPLVDLETKCTIHDSYDLIDEKKKMIGGKLEVKVRVRNPILSKQLEKVTEKWIIIDGF